MVIELFTEELIKRIRSISHREVSEIPDAEARYRAEAGTEKMDDIQHSIEDAHLRLMGRCGRFLTNAYGMVGDNMMVIPPSYVYEFNMGERRSINKVEPLREAMNTFLVEYALSKFYSNVSQGELSNKHSLLAIEAGNMIDQLLYSKMPPLV